MNTLAILLQTAPGLESYGLLSAAFAAAITALAAAFGIGFIGRSAVESIARQPEAAGDIRSSMIVSAALIEGVSFFAIVTNLLIVVL